MRPVSEKFRTFENIYSNCGEYLCFLNALEEKKTQCKTEKKCLEDLEKLQKKLAATVVSTIQSKTHEKVTDPTRACQIKEGQLSQIAPLFYKERIEYQPIGFVTCHRDAQKNLGILEQKFFQVKERLDSLVGKIFLCEYRKLDLLLIKELTNVFALYEMLRKEMIGTRQSLNSESYKVQEKKVRRIIYIVWKRKFKRLINDLFFYRKPCAPLTEKQCKIANMLCQWSHKR